jgi:hypothetical protein
MFVVKNSPKNSILDKKTVKNTRVSTIKSEALSISTVPRRESIGILSDLRKLRQRVISPILGIAKFTVYPIIRAEKTFQKGGL